MKRFASFSLLILFAALFITNAGATIRRVGFIQTITPVPGFDYTTFQLAANDAVNGDTIQLSPSTIGSGAAYSGTVNKRLVVIGPGYNTNSYNLYNPYSISIANTGLNTLPGTVYNTTFTIGVGSAGSIFQGLISPGFNTSNTLDSLNDITIMRCRDVSVNFDNSGVCNNWIITQCIRVNVAQTGFGLSFTANRSITNLRIENCLGPRVGYTASGKQSPVGINSGQILNCVWYGNFQPTSIEHATMGTSHFNNSVFVIQNCIDGMGYLSSNNMYDVANTIFVNNHTTATALNNFVATNPGSSGNVFSISIAGNSYFAGVPNNISGSTTLYSPDAAWQLSASSPAKNAGFIPGTATPTDLGIYGGTNPYKPSGIAAIPTFYKFQASSSQATSSPYTVIFSVRNNN
ncbi:MAG: hypothetical protein V4722_24790 [Bacteroidota bacterium]